jgi:hypothetical protein
MNPDLPSFTVERDQGCRCPAGFYLGQKTAPKETAPARNGSAEAANLEAGFLPEGANLPEAWSRRLLSRNCSTRARLHGISAQAATRIATPQRQSFGGCRQK